MDFIELAKSRYSGHIVQVLSLYIQIAQLYIIYFKKSSRMGVKVSIRTPASKQTQPCSRLGAT